MIDYKELAQHTGALKRAIDAGLPSQHWKALGDVVVGRRDNERLDTARVRLVALGLQEEADKLEAVAQALLTQVGDVPESATDDELSAEEKRKGEYGRAAKDKTPAAADAVATDSGLVLAMTHHTPNSWRDKLPTAQRSPSWLDKLMPKKG